jgi:hypothetical protein
MIIADGDCEEMKRQDGEDGKKRSDISISTLANLVQQIGGSL